MITLLREFTKSWFFKGLMVLLIASFAVFGLRDVFSKTGGDNVVEAGSRKISALEFKNQVEQQKQQYAQKNQGTPFTNEEFVQAGQHLVMLNQLADQTAFSAWLDSLGVKATSKQIVAKIAEIPAFFNSVTGRFDKDTYRDVLARNQMTEKQLEGEFSDQIAAQQYLVATAAGFRTPRIYAASQAAMALQSRDASLLIVDHTAITLPSPPTDADLQAYYDSHKSQWQLPEFRSASVVRFGPDQYISQIKIDETAVRKMYDDRLKTLVTPETRSFVKISAPNAGAASAIAAALKSGKTPEEAAKANKGQVISYDLKPQSAEPDPKVAAAAFALKTDDISGPIQGDLGYAVVKMGEIKTGATPSYESVHAELAQEYIKNEAANRVNKDSNAFSDAVRAGKDFDVAAKELGLTVVKLAPMTAEGQTPNPQQSYAQYVNLVKTIFDLPSKGAASDVEELGEGQYFAVRLDDLKPAGAPKFEEVKGEIAQMWMTEKVAAAVSTKADEIQARVNKGESLEAVAASLNLKVTKAPGISRQTARQSGLPNPVLGRIFMGQAGSTFNTQIGQTAYAIGRIDAVHQADVQSANISATVARSQMSQEVISDLMTGTQQGARAAVKAKTYPNTALTALGMSPQDAKAKKPDEKSK